MAINRCFNTFTPNTTSSDYMNTTRQKTLYSEINYNVNTFSNANPKKNNNFSYNKNFGVSETNNTGGVQGCLTFANNYQLLLDITKGETIMANQSINCDISNNILKMNAPIYDAWSGNLYSVDYTKLNHGDIIQPILQTEDVAEDDKVFIVDPSHVLFYESCPITDITCYPPEWFNTVDISFNNTEYYIEANSAQIMNGFNYPEKVIFGKMRDISAFLHN